MKSKSAAIQGALWAASLFSVVAALISLLVHNNRSSATAMGAVAFTFAVVALGARRARSAG